MNSAKGNLAYFREPLELSLQETFSVNAPATFFVDVVLPLYLPKLFTYRIPESMVEEVVVGKRVAVQFGKGKVYTAIVFEVHSRVPSDYEAKYLQAVVDEHPLVSDIQIQFWKWMAEYYLCSLGEVMLAALPSGLRLESETRIVLRNADEINYTELTDKEYLIVEALEVQKELTVKHVSHILEIKNVYQVIRSLFLKEIIWVKEELVQTYKPKKVECVRLAAAYQQDEAMNILMQLLEKKAPKQVDLLLGFWQLSRVGNAITKSELMKQTGCTAAVIKSMVEKGIFESYTQTTDRLKAEDNIPETFDLNEEQQAACDTILNDFAWQGVNTETKPVLLHGITSSGKTHVYVRMIEECLKRDKQVLYLLPEIALTGQIVKRLRKYFGSRVMVSHSKFNENERVEIWNRLSDGKIDIIIGARSAIFLPFNKLGLIIVDEEHENSYKQQEPAPRYHARDAALVLAKMHEARVLLGSATPSMETYYNALQGRYGLALLAQRFGGVSVPIIELADTAYERKVQSLKLNFTKKLLDEMEHALENGKQVILFQNRRGFVPLMECATCGTIPKCQHCDISLTWHKYNNTLKCHYCGYREDMTGTCKACGNHDLKLKGFGTEKIEEDLTTLMPNARIARLDSETTRSKKGHEKIIGDLEDKKTDILIGTQMVSKGLDFENVTLVGIMNADQLLHFPDFRANERSFQMLIQVAGRAGRRATQGKVIIQTALPSHPILQLVIEHNYVGFFHHELKERERFHYPPFYRVIRIMLKSKDQHILNEASEEYGNLLRTKLGSRMLGPELPIISRIQDYYQKQILVKLEREGTSFASLKKFIKQQTETILGKHKKLIIIADVDPY